MNDLENAVKDVSERKIKANFPLWVVVALLAMTGGIAYFWF